MTNRSPPDGLPDTGRLYDEMLVLLVQAGDRRALERLFRRWNPRLTRAARRYCGTGDSAGDLAQECWLAIVRRLGGLRDPSRFRSFAFAVLHHRGADLLRKNNRERATLDRHEPIRVEASSPPERIAISQAFAALPPDQRLAAHLYFVEGLTLVEIAEVQAVPQGTAKSRLFHARRKLKAALSEDTPIKGEPL